MLNITIIILISLILISQNILLLNEETLVLVCFVTFIWLSYNKLSQNIKTDLTNQSNNIKSSIEKSFDQLIFSLNNELKNQKEFENLIHNFKKIKFHLISLNTITAAKFPEFSLNYYQNTYKKKLIFTQKLEKQTAKLLALLITRKLVKIVTLKKFYIQSFQYPTLKCTQKISLREYFNFV
uniref:ATP synthase B chain n=1 Tax=Pterocladiella musciformis TaxID=2699131 RepID=A0A1D8X7S3_9FLOR|nr:ATP synthase B chain precursor [Pterocladiella musciformis]AOX49081.1 ATP synthase B chain precursor [Pterocladiella musciformis]